MLTAERIFPILAIVVSLLAWQNPDPLLGLTDIIIPLLTIIMFSMGLTLRWEDFQRIWRKPQPVALGILLQFGLMPLIAWGLTLILELPDDIATGLILVGACAGGTASNVMTFLARGDVALSVTMTTASTLWGIFLTPLLVSFYASDTININEVGMLIMIAKIVVVPVTLGVLLNRWLPQVRQSVNQYLPSVATGSILLIIAVVVAANADELAVMSGAVILAVIIHNLLGFTAGYSIARWNGSTVAESRTIAIEVGMQNSGLGVALANSFFGPLAALPGALFSIWQNIAGALLAGFWKWQTDRRIREATNTQVRQGIYKAKGKDDN